MRTYESRASRHHHVRCAPRRKRKRRAHVIKRPMRPLHAPHGPYHRRIVRVSARKTLERGIVIARARSPARRERDEERERARARHSARTRTHARGRMRRGRRRRRGRQRRRPSHRCAELWRSLAPRNMTTFSRARARALARRRAWKYLTPVCARHIARERSSARQARTFRLEPDRAS